MAECTNCKDNILNKKPTIIGATKCNGDCPEDLNCLENIKSNCINYTGDNKSCLGVTTGMNLNQVISQVEISCQNNSGVNNCKSKISENDECCGYLSDKIVGGNGISVTTETGIGNCQTVVISETCATWNTVTNPMFAAGGGWRNYNNGYQQLQYSSVKECTVKIRGVALCPSYANEITNGLIFILPVGFRPSVIRSYPLVINSASPTGYFAGFVEIFPNGNVMVRLTTATGGYKEVKAPIEISFEV